MNLEGISVFQASFYLDILDVFITTWPIWLPVVMVSGLMTTWLTYKRRQWLFTQGSILLEIRIPREVERSPAAMELLLYGIWEDVPGSITDVFLKGRVRDQFSLEIASIGGEVKFYIWAFPKWKNIIESRIYAQYPGAEVYEVKDYSLNVHFDPEKMKISGITTGLVKADAYPIRTYIDYELDKNNKESEEIIDPLVPLLDFMGTLRKNEQAWVQILIQAHRKEGFSRDAKFIPKPDRMTGIKDEIKKIINEDAFIKAKEGSPQSLQNLTSTQTQTIDAIQRNAGKHAYDTMMRVLYTAPIDEFDGMKCPAGIVGSMRQFGSVNLNGIKPLEFIPGITFPWDNFFDENTGKHRQRTHLDAYKRRSFFNVPYKHLMGKPFILSVEELATLYHFPGREASTPAIVRVPSKKAEAPSNLPV